MTKNAKFPPKQRVRYGLPDDRRDGTVLPVDMSYEVDGRTKGDNDVVVAFDDGSVGVLPADLLVRLRTKRGGQLERVMRERDSLTLERDTLLRARESLRERLEETNQLAIEAGVKKDKANAEVDSLRADLDLARKDFAESKELVEFWRDKFEKAIELLGIRGGELDGLRKELDSVRDAGWRRADLFDEKEEELRAEMARVTKERNVACFDRDAARIERGTLTASHATIRNELNEARGRIDTLLFTRDTLNAELELLRAKLAEKEAVK